MRNIEELEKLMTEEQKRKAAAAYKKHYEDLFDDDYCWLAAGMTFEERLERAYGKIISGDEWE